MLNCDIYDPPSLSYFLSPLNRFVAIIEYLLPAAIEADFVPSHYESSNCVSPTFRK